MAHLWIIFFQRKLLYFYGKKYKYHQFYTVELHKSVFALSVMINTQVYYHGNYALWLMKLFIL